MKNGVQIKYPRTLVISNNCFSKSGSNGRTLANFFRGWPKKRLAQFYIQNEIPDSEVCDNYFRVTDSEAVQSFITGQMVGEVVDYKKDEANNIKDRGVGNKIIKRTPITSILRDVIWNSYRWKKDNFNNWVEKFDPELILIQAGDSGFMLNLAVKLSKQFDIPLVIYNSESYYFKKYNYMEGKGISSYFYSIFHKNLKKQYNKAIGRASHSIYICDMLKQEYDREFNKPSTTIMTSTELKLSKGIKNKKVIPVISYLGNLGVGRDEPLIEIANKLQEINSEFYLDVYGQIPSDEIKAKFEKCKGIRYKGLITYDEVICVMQNSDILVHGENSADFYKEDLKYAFSTKIADSLASGTCFFVYAPKEIACTKYLLDNECACVATDINELKNKLKKILFNEDERQRYITNAQKIVIDNHNSEINRQKFYNILCKAKR